MKVNRRSAASRVAKRGPPSRVDTKNPQANAQLQTPNPEPRTPPPASSHLLTTGSVNPLNAFNSARLVMPCAAFSSAACAIER